MRLTTVRYYRLWFEFRCFWAFGSGIALSLRELRDHKVKTLVQADVQSENLTFFTARNPAISSEKSPGTALDRPNRQCQLGSVPFWCRGINGKKARTTSIGLRQWQDGRKEPRGHDPYGSSD